MKGYDDNELVVEVVFEVVFAEEVCGDAGVVRVPVAHFPPPDVVGFDGRGDCADHVDGVLGSLFDRVADDSPLGLLTFKQKKINCFSGSPTTLKRRKNHGSDDSALLRRQCRGPRSRQTGGRTRRPGSPKPDRDEQSRLLLHPMECQPRLRQDSGMRGRQRPGLDSQYVLRVSLGR